MKRATSLLLAASLAVGVGASVFHFTAAPAGSFNGTIGGTPTTGYGLGGACGLNDTCAAVSYTATTTDGGVGFGCTGQGDCLDLGPGNCNSIATDSNGYIHLGGANSCGTLVYVGDSTMLQQGAITLTNGAANLNGTTYIRNASGAVDVDDADGLLLAPQASTPSCSSGNKGTFSTLSGDGLAYYCNGTLAQQVALKKSWSSTLDFASVPSNDCADLTFTATGAVADEVCVCGGCASIRSADAHVTCQCDFPSTNTGRVRVCNNAGVATVDFSPIVFTLTALR